MRGSSGETIYTHYRIVDSFPVCDNVCYGLDFGYNHPTALIKVGEQDNRIYAEELLYESKLTNDDLAYLVKTMVGITRRSVVYCDHARPEAIEELRRAGINAQPANKAVWDGIKYVKSRPLNIVRTSANLVKEIKSYKWKVDKLTGTTMEEPVKFMDDAMDAMRYGIYTGLSKPEFKIRPLL